MKKETPASNNFAQGEKSRGKALKIVFLLNFKNGRNHF